jgi:DICT domain-containing protein
VLVGVAERGVVVLVGLEWRRGIGGGVIGLARIRPLGRLYGVIVGVGVLVAVLRHVASCPAVAGEVPTSRGGFRSLDLFPTISRLKSSEPQQTVQVSAEEFSIQQIAEQTGVPEATLRVWERRHGFPTPRRLPGGHRRYSHADVELVQRVARDRAAGMTLSAAIARASEVAETTLSSVFASLRRDHPDLQPRRLSKPLLLALTHAIEDEGLARAERPLIFAGFQAERFYRQSEPRWRQLSRSAELAIAFADFPGVRTPSDGAIEIPVSPDSPFLREWTLILWAPGHTACLSAWEPPAREANGGAGGAGGARSFEAIWSVEPTVVHEAATVCADLASASLPELRGPLTAQLGADPGPPAAHQLRLATAITNRMLSYLS